MISLFESPAGFALFKVLDEGKLSNVEDLCKEFSSPDSAPKMVKLIAFDKFDNTSEAQEAIAKLMEGTPSEGLLKFLKLNCEGEVLAVADSKLGDVIKEKLKIDCVHNDSVMELLRGIRSQYTELISGLGDQDLAPMNLRLSHSLARHTLKISYDDKVESMVIQTVGKLDDLDKEVNKCSTRIRGCYRRHFPELANIIHDNILYVKVVKLMGNRINAAKLDFSEVNFDNVTSVMRPPLTKGWLIETDLKEAAMTSRGKGINDLNLVYIRELCDQVLAFDEQRAQLHDDLKISMNIVAPNLTALVGEVVGARLISHAGGLLNLAKLPGSTIQMLKTKYATPKYGLIYQTSLVGEAAPEHKGKIARSLAAKVALAIRCDAFGDGQNKTMGLQDRAKLEARLRNIEGEGKPEIEVYDKTTPDQSEDSEEPSNKKVEEEEEEFTRRNLFRFMLWRFTKICQVHIGSYFARCFGS